MELNTGRSLYAMDWPRPSLGLERTMVRGMPIPGGEDRSTCAHKSLYISIENRDDLIPFRDRQSSAGAEIVLYIHYN
jgi:hypothetical protein